MQPLHPLIEKAILTSTSNRGALEELSTGALFDDKVSVSAAHAQLQNECDCYYGLGLNYTTYVGIHENGQPWSIVLANDVSGKTIHPLGITAPPQKRRKKAS